MLVTLLISLLVILVILYIISLFPIDGRIKTAIYLIVLVIALIWLLRHFAVV